MNPQVVPDKYVLATYNLFHSMGFSSFILPLPWFSAGFLARCKLLLRKRKRLISLW